MSDNSDLAAALQSLGASMAALAKSSSEQGKTLVQMNQGLTLLLERQSAGNIRGGGGVSLGNLIVIIVAACTVGGVMLTNLSVDIEGNTLRAEEDNLREMKDAYEDGRRDERLNEFSRKLRSET